MSLYKQLSIFIVTLFTVMFCGTFYVNFHSTQNFLTKQLLSQAEDTATALELSLSTDLQKGNIAALQTTVNAFFDRGYYLEIMVRDIESRVLVSRQQPITIQGVPSWFIDLLDIKSPEVIQEVSNGWTIAGDIKVVEHTGYAYQKLWETLNISFIWFLSASVALIIFGNSILKALLKPLMDITHQAEAVCRRQYGEQITLPKTKELRTVVAAMNRMTSKVKSMFDEQAKIAARLRETSYMDPLTGLGNQRYFKEQLSTYLSETDKFKMGVLIIIQIDEFGRYNKRNGLQAGDALLMAFSKIIKQHTGGFGDTALSRISGGDFAMFIMEVETKKAEQLAQKLMDSLSQLYLDKIYDQQSVCHCGLLMLEKPQDMRSVFSSADQALRLAQAKGNNVWQRFEHDGLDVQEIAGRQDWLKHLSQAIHTGDVNLLIQSAVRSNTPEKVLHQEAFVQILDNYGQPCPAGMFMVSAEQLGLSQLIDRLVIRKIVKHLQSLPPSAEESFAINLSINSLKDEGFMQWLEKTLKSLDRTSNIHPEKSGLKRIVFEFTESVVIQNLGKLNVFSNFVRQFGHGLGLDQFGRGFSDFGYLKSLKPSYVKIDRTYTTQIENSPDKQFFVSTLCNISRSLEILVIAQAVENQSQWDTLKTLHIDAIQGYVIDRPSAFKA